ncbi:hypothetical protein B0A48_16518 [Cryoendolithus antarcticus]|uniref:Rhodopsin domain-containing protein n=1 Tax=Cryoendolithus antarcticus TaxID=1507870 RepID=A0A1V8SET3_9PEZI|nr:hypothetical protein B0A48_16518 [Cryoendolithus antarcticus]
MSTSGDDPKTSVHRGNQIFVVAVAFLAVAWLGVSLRTWVRAVMVKSYGWDDAVLLLAAVSFTLYCSFNILLSDMGFGSPEILQNTPATISTIVTYMITTFALYASTMVLVKISLGIFYLRIAIEKWQRWTVWVTLIISTIYGTYYFFAAIFQCGNPKYFLRNALAGKCGGSPNTLLPVNMTAGVINAVSDLVMVILPIFLIRKASMPKRAKISAYGVVALGSIGGVVSLLRLKYIKDLSYVTNFFETGVTITLWSIAEAGIAIIAASLATVRPIFRCCLDNTRRALGSGTGGSRQKHSQLSSTDTTSHGVSRKISSRLARRQSDLSFQDRGAAFNPTPAGAWPMTEIKEEERPRPDKVDTTAEERPFPEFTQRGSVKKGKIYWEEKRAATPTLPPPAVLPGAQQQPNEQRRQDRAPSASRSPPPLAGKAPRPARREAMALDSAVGVSKSVQQIPPPRPARTPSAEERNWKNPRSSRSRPPPLQHAGSWKDRNTRRKDDYSPDRDTMSPQTFLRAPSMCDIEPESPVIGGVVGDEYDPSSIPAPRNAAAPPARHASPISSHGYGMAPTLQPRHPFPRLAPARDSDYMDWAAETPPPRLGTQSMASDWRSDVYRPDSVDTMSKFR